MGHDRKPRTSPKHRLKNENDFALIKSKCNTINSQISRVLNDMVKLAISASNLPESRDSKLQKPFSSLFNHETFML